MILFFGQHRNFPLALTADTMVIESAADIMLLVAPFMLFDNI
jgi:hypothetical protein